ncbi:DNA (cytosine-5-)-methyltransferase [Acinetobacter sp. ANC 5054]|uniref:DNA cytosine methyltransferase n=1 Tax=Acinetobacter sp. ANC 5054 TaxID=1977877 RepID=UPI000A35ADEF|nr:DNA cytosine methyltransferase [Acinetobacter sp. ANC 5054]OTG83516.1 DNA (cytosine-5-)-methyltransferase [Acinetobacter sp. ANC 5054]
MNKKPTLVDLFCGCGGFGLGGELAGFHSVAAIDIDPTLQSAYKNNFPNTKVINTDLTKINDVDWKEITNNIEIDGVIGGPPCQGYSRMGAGDINDPRRKLLDEFFRHVNILLPKFFVMENVEGLMDRNNRPQLDKAISIVDKRYKILDPIIIDASKCGAPTTRKRVIVIGYDPKRMKTLSKEDFVFNEPTTTVADAISDLSSPILQSKDSNDFGFSPYRFNNNLSKYALIMREQPPKGLGTNEAKLELKFHNTSGYFETIHNGKVKERYKSIIPGKTDPISRSKKLAWDGLCPTLRAGTGSDKGSHQAVRPLHPEEGRVITVREAARLQGFPDWFTFHPTKWHSFRMIGNSVSPIVSNKILTIIYANLENKLLKKSA